MTAMKAILARNRDFERFLRRTTATYECTKCLDGLWAYPEGLLKLQIQVVTASNGLVTASNG